jgi:hypothetical protein
MMNLAGSGVWLAPKNAKPPDPLAQHNAQPEANPEQVTRPRPRHYQQETLLNTLFEFSIGLSALFGILYGLLQLVHWTWHALTIALPLGR